MHWFLVLLNSDLEVQFIYLHIFFICCWPTHCYKQPNIWFISCFIYIMQENCGDVSLQELQGRPWKLFLSSTNTAIAHCVSNDFQMDKGIAKQFLKKYGNFNELKKKGDSNIFLRKLRHMFSMLHQKYKYCKSSLHLKETGSLFQVSCFLQAKRLEKLVF